MDVYALAFLDAIAIGENYDPTEYNELVGGGHFQGYEDFPDWSGRHFPAGISHAAGRYQFEPATWRGQAAKLGLSDFSPASQDVAAWDLACVDYHRHSGGRSLQQDLKVGFFNWHALQSTWTSVGVHTLDRFVGALTARRMYTHE